MLNVEKAHFFACGALLAVRVKPGSTLWDSVVSLWPRGYVCAGVKCSLVLERARGGKLLRKGEGTCSSGVSLCA